MFGLQKKSFLYRKLFFLWLVNLCLLVLPLLARAEELSPESLINLEAIEQETYLFENDHVITATRQARRASELPFAVYVLHRSDIKALCPRDLADLIRVLPGIDFFQMRDRVAGAGAPGFTTEYSNQHLVLIDGISFPTNRGGGADWSSLPVLVDDIERIEFVPGPQSTLYGPYAATGVIHIITRFHVTKGRTLKRELHDRMGEDGFKKSSFSYLKASEDKALTLWGSWRRSKGFGPATDQSNAVLPGYENAEISRDRRLGGSYRRNYGKGKSLRLDLSYLTNDHAILNPVFRGDGCVREYDLSSSLTYRYTLSPTDEWTINLKHRKERNRYTESPYALFAQDVKDGFFQDHQIELQRTFTNGRGHRWVAGAQFVELEAAGPLYMPGRHKLRDLSAFAQSEIPLSKRNTLFAGGNLYHSSQTSSNHTWKLFLLHRREKNESFRIGLSTAVRGADLGTVNLVSLPQMLHPTLGLITLSTPFSSPNPNVDVERHRVGEVAYNRIRKNNHLQLRFQAGHGLNLITFIPVGPFDPLTGTLPFILGNGSTPFHFQSFSTTWKREFSKPWTLRLTHRYLHSNEPRRLAPLHYGKISLTYNPKQSCFLTLALRVMSSYAALSGSSSPSLLAGHGLLDLMFRKKLRSKKRELWLRVDNIFDREVREIFPAAAQPPQPSWSLRRSISFGMTRHF